MWSLQTRKDTPEWRDSARLANVASITADGQTITLTLTEPDSSLLWNLTGRAGLILKEGDTVDYKTKANGTGPFALTQLAAGRQHHVRPQRRLLGRRGAGRRGRLRLHPRQPGGAQRRPRRRGRRAHRLRREPEGADRGRPATSPLELGESTDKGTLAFNQAAGSPLADKRVRQAIRQAIDHDAIVEALASGQTLYGPIPELDPGYEDLSDVAPYDPEAAKALLAEAGAEDLTLDADDPELLLHDDPADPRLGPQRGRHHARRSTRSTSRTWLNDVYINKDYDLSFVLHTEARDFENWANPDYYFTYDNPEVQDLYAQSLAATDEAEAADLLAQAARIVSEDPAADWLYNGASVVAVGTNITGLALDQRQRAPQPRRARQERRVIRYTLTRLALLLLGLFVASVLIFLTLRVLPGDVAQLIAGINSTPEQVEAIRERLGLEPAAPGRSTSTGSAASSAATSAPRC